MRPRIRNKFEQKENGITVGYATDGSEFLIDTEDKWKISEFTWRANDQGYIYTKISYGGKDEIMFLHRLIMDTLDKDWHKVQVDHINHNPRDNRKENLRITTPSGNQHNRKNLRPDNSSGYTGVMNRNNKWIATIGIDGKIEFLGSFNTKEEAISMRKRAEEYFFGKKDN